MRKQLNSPTDDIPFFGRLEDPIDWVVDGTDLDSPYGLKVNLRILIVATDELIKRMDKMDKKIKKIEKEEKKVGKDLKKLGVADKKRDKMCEMGKKAMKKHK